MDKKNEAGPSKKDLPRRKSVPTDEKSKKLAAILKMPILAPPETEKPTKPSKNAFVRDLIRVNLVKTPPFDLVQILLMFYEFLIHFSSNSLFCWVIFSGFIPLKAHFLFQVASFGGMFFGVFLGWMADSYVGKLYLFWTSIVLFFLLTSFKIIVSFNILPFQNIFIHVVIYSSFLFPSFLGTRHSLFADQIGEENLRTFLFLIFLFRFLADLIVCGTAMLFKPYLLVYIILELILFFILFILFIWMKKEIKVLPKNNYAVEKALKNNIKSLKMIIFITILITFGTCWFASEEIFQRQFSIMYDSPNHPLAFITLDRSVFLLMIVAVELVIVPIFKFSDLFCICISSFLMCGALLISFFIQILLENEYRIPYIGEGQVRFYNPSGKNISLSSSWFESEIEPRGFLTHDESVDGILESDLSVTFDRLIINGSIIAEETKSISYVLLSNGEVAYRLLGYDPVYFSPFNSTTKAFLVAQNSRVYGQFHLYDREKVNLVCVVNVSEHAERVHINAQPGFYTFVYVAQDERIYVENETINLSVGGVYSFFIVDANPMLVDVHELVEPAVEYQPFVYPQIFVRNAALAFFLVPFCHLCISETDESLRSFVLSYAYFISHVGIGLNIWLRLKFWYVAIGKRIILALCCVHFVFLIPLIVFSKNYNFAKK